jgi:hypothetical protein
MGGHLHRWSLGFNQCRFSLYPFWDFMHTGLAGRFGYIPSPYPAFLPCLFPLCLSALGRVGVLEGNCPQPSAPLGLFSSRRSGAHRS